MSARGLLSVALAAWALLASTSLEAATPLPLTPPPPDIASLIPFAAAPIDKPALSAPAPPVPPPPVELPHVPPARVTGPTAEKPRAQLAAPGTAPCFWSWLPSASEQLKCGLARLYRAENDKARESLEQAARGSDRSILSEARYWLAETWWILGRPDQADPLFRQVALEPRDPLAGWALSGSGWTALRLNDFARARDVFGRLVASPIPAPLDGWSRHGLGLALYGLGRFEEAERAWADARAKSVPGPLTRDVQFWYGETLGRVGRYDDAVKELKQFTDGGQHPLLDTGLLRLGWWTLAAGRGKDAVTPLRAALAMPPRPASGPTAGGPNERDWADAGLALALLDAADGTGARQAAQALRTRKSPLEVPVMLRLAAAAVQAKRGAEALPIVQDLLGAKLDAPTRTWVLILGGDANLAEGKSDDARTQYDLARQGDNGVLGAHARLRLARTNYELREFTQAMADVAPLLGAPLPADLRNAALLLRGEAAYHAGDYTTAADTFRRALIEQPKENEAAGVRLALGWTALRQGRKDEARRHIVEFVKAQPDHPLAGDALMLASELAVAAGDLEDARGLIERVLTSYPSHPRIEFAKLNRGLLLLRSGQPGNAEPIFREWIARAPFPPLVGRAHLGLGTALLTMGKPADAAREFAAAAKAGEGSVATLGAGAVALAQGRADDAKKTLTDARDAGPDPVTSAANYGLAAVEFQRGDAKSFATVARAALPTSGPATAPWLLYLLTGFAAEANDWPSALDTGKRLVNDYPAHETADDALERIGSAAVSARAWPVAQESYALLVARYPKSPFADAARVALAEAQINTGRAPDAIATLERFVNDNPTHPDVSRAWLGLARARENAGLSQAAAEAYVNAMRDARTPEVRRDAVAGQARMLVAEKKFGEARSLLHPLIRERDNAIVAEAAQAIGETYRGEGDALSAAEFFMTAAYVAPDTPIARKAMLAAAQSLATARQPDAAAALYRKLLAQTNLPPDMTESARQGLSSVTNR